MVIMQLGNANQYNRYKEKRRTQMVTGISTNFPKKL